jgi:aryl-alcohol dehydrogenase-like predicted oxidoreductase
LSDSIQSLPLVLGTAQLGMNYGIANKEGKPSREKALEIVAEAWDKGIRFFDTAQAYGESESILGECLRALGDGTSGDEPAVISKLHPEVRPSDEQAVLRAVGESLERLKIKTLWGLMLHRESWLEGASSALESVADHLKREGKIKFFGISVYSPEMASKALNTTGIDLVQMPFNVFDQRALRQGIFESAKKKNKTLFVRSVYLQGLLLLDPEDLPRHMLFSRKALSLFRETARKENLSPKLLALSYVVRNAGGALIVIGAEVPSQVTENVDLLKKAQQVSLPDLAILGQEDPKLINPAAWVAS